MEDYIARAGAFIFAIVFGWLFHSLLKSVLVARKAGQPLLDGSSEGDQAVILLIALPAGSVLLLAYAFGFI